MVDEKLYVCFFRLNIFLFLFLQFEFFFDMDRWIEYLISQNPYSCNTAVLTPLSRFLFEKFVNLLRGARMQSVVGWQVTLFGYTKSVYHCDLLIPAMKYSSGITWCGRQPMKFCTTYARGRVWKCSECQNVIFIRCKVVKEGDKYEWQNHMCTLHNMLRQNHEFTCEMFTVIWDVYTCSSLSWEETSLYGSSDRGEICQQKSITSLWSFSTEEANFGCSM